VAPVMGLFTLMALSGYTIYVPVLFPSRLRTTGCGFAYNAARILAAGAPFAIGFLGKKYGFPQAASMVVCVYVLGFVGTAMAPETKGLPLPDDKDFETGPAVRIAPAPQET